MYLKNFIVELNKKIGDSDKYLVQAGIDNMDYSDSTRFFNIVTHIVDNKGFDYDVDSMKRIQKNIMKIVYRLTVHHKSLDDCMTDLEEILHIINDKYFREGLIEKGIKVTSISTTDINPFEVNNGFEYTTMVDITVLEEFKRVYDIAEVEAIEINDATITKPN